MSSARVFPRFWFHLVLGILLGSLCMLESARAQGNCTPPAFTGDESSWRSAYINWCTSNGGQTGNFYDSGGNYTGWGCHQGSQWKCGSSSTTSPTDPAASLGTTLGNAAVTIVQSYENALAAARAREAAERDAATGFNHRMAAAASQNAEVTEDQAQENDLARFQASQANVAQANQNEFASAHASTGDFLNSALSSNSSDLTHATPAQQKAWKQLHCLAYVSRIAFVDLALNNIKDYHDLAPEASKAFEGASMDVSCPSTPFPDLSGKNNVDMGKVNGKLKSDLDQASQIAQRLEKLNPQQITLPPVPPDVAADPKLAAAWKVQQAINAINDAPNPGKTPDEFAQVIKDRDKLRQSLGDADNAANGNFGSIQVDLGSAAPAAQSTSSSSGSSGTPPQ